MNNLPFSEDSGGSCSSDPGGDDNGSASCMDSSQTGGLPNAGPGGGAGGPGSYTGGQIIWVNGIPAPVCVPPG